MKRTLLNLSLLQPDSPAILQPGTSPTPRAGLRSGAPPSGSTKITRRTLLGLAGAAASGAAAYGISPSLRVIEPTLWGEFALKEDPDRVAFTLGGRERWVIDARRFGGSPHVRTSRSGNRIRVQLTGALFPGTTLPADMTCEVWRALVGWRISLRMALGGFAAQAPLEGWLAGAETLESHVNLQATTHLPGASGDLSLSGPGHARFSAGWTLSLAGAGIATVSACAETFRGDAMSLSLSAAGSPGLMTESTARRTFFAIARGTRDWPLPPGLLVKAAREDGRALPGDQSPEQMGRSGRRASGPFDRLCVETSESRAGRNRAALLFEGPGHLVYQPHDHLRDRAGQPVRVGLQSPRYMVFSDGRHTETALAASFSPSPAWISFKSCRLQVAGLPETPPFRRLTRDGRTVELDCAPALLQAIVPLDGASAGPFTPESGTLIQLAAAALAPLRPPILARPLPPILTPQPRVNPNPAPNPTPAPNPGLIERPPTGSILNDHPNVKVLPGIQEPIIKLPGNFSVAVVRPNDLLGLVFGFINLRLEAGGQPAQLVRANAGQSSYIIVVFPPQSIGEEAFFEGDDNYHSTNQHDPEQTRTSSDTPVPPPVRSILSGPSRIVFRVPDKTNSIEYSLSNLLDWTQFEPSVAPTALPPAQEFIHPSTLHLNPGNFQLHLLSYSGGANTSLAAEEGPIRPMLPPRTRPLPRPGFHPPVIVNPGILQLNPVLAAPQLTETAIESPFRLLLSPNVLCGWAHSLKAPAAGQQRVELWHTRLGVLTPDGVSELDSDAHDRTVRAIWATDFEPNAPDLPNHANSPFRMSMDIRDRYEIVRLTSDWTMNVLRKPYTPLPVPVERMMLTSLGAWLKVRGTWGPNLPEAPFKGHDQQELTVTEWDHIATQGRDQYVRIVYEGYLAPFGHSATLVKVTERKFEYSERAQANVAYLRQHMYIVIKEPVKTYPLTGVPDGAGRDLGRKNPFQQVRITTLVTPNLDKPELSEALPGAGQDAFWPRVAQSDFLFHLIGTDRTGQTTEFTAPLIFAANNVAADGAKSKALGNSYNAAADRARRPMSGQRIAYAPEHKLGDTTFETQTLHFGVFVVPPRPLQSPFRPTVEGAVVGMAAVRHLSGQDHVPTVRFYDEYLRSEFQGNNKGGVFLELIDNVASGKAAPVTLNFPSDKSGGIATPNLDISGVSRQLGPVGGALSSIGQGTFDPSQFFKDMTGNLQLPKILGGVSLLDILEVVGDITGGDGLSRVPKMLSSTLTGGDSLARDLDTLASAIPGSVGGGAADAINNSIADVKQKVQDYTQNQSAAAKQALQNAINGLKGQVGGIQDQLPMDLVNNLQSEWNDLATFFQNFSIPQEVRVSYDWNTPVKSALIFEAGPDSKLTIAAAVTAYLDGRQPSYSINGKLNDFSINLLPGFSFISISFSAFEFSSTSGHKMDVNPGIKGVNFLGPLAFVQQLTQYLPSPGGTPSGTGGGFDDPPFVDVAADSVTAGYTMAIPSIGVGVFSLENLSLTGALTIPFTGDPVRARFAFCERQNPFLISVSLFAGGGFFGVGFGLDGIEMMEASFEFGGNFSMDIGVASGGVHIMAGIYFKMEKVPPSTSDEITLTGYVRLGGELEVLGIISLSLEFYLGLTYQSEGNKVWGQATLTVGISILFFSASVSLSVEREFADPPVPSLLDPDGWATYCGAFADAKPAPAIIMPPRPIRPIVPRAF